MLENCGRLRGMTHEVGDDCRPKLLVEGTVFHDGDHAAAACPCCRRLGQQHHLHESMVRHAFKRLRKRLLCLRFLPVPQSKRADRVPGVRAALTRIQVA